MRSELYSQQSMSKDSEGNVPTCANFFRRYFCEGQATAATLAKRRGSRGEGGSIDEATNGSCFATYRQVLGLLVPAFVVHGVWWWYMLSNDRFEAFTRKSGDNEIPRWYMSITMIFGSMLAGATSEGGAAVAFPVMTLAFGINPVVARDFSFMIQSVGMTAASLTIFWMGVVVEWKAICWCTLGGVAGIIFGLEKCILDPPYAKMYFVVIWGAFAASLYWLNRIRGRKVYLVLDPPHLPIIWEDANIFQLAPRGIGSYVCVNWKALVLLVTGFLGGIFSSIAGSGIDISSFACLTLLFRISEKTATPTSVVLMAINTVVGFLYREYGQGGVEEDAWGFLLVCAPIVSIGAPLGSILGSFVHRLVLAWAVYITDVVQLLGALIIVKPWVKDDSTPGKDTPLHLTSTSAVIFVSGIIFFYSLQLGGRRVLAHNSKLEEQFSYLNAKLPQLLAGDADLGLERASALYNERVLQKHPMQAPNNYIRDEEEKGAVERNGNTLEMTNIGIKAEDAFSSKITATI